MSEFSNSKFNSEKRFYQKTSLDKNGLHTAPAPHLVDFTYRSGAKEVFLYTLDVLFVVKIISHIGIFRILISRNNVKFYGIKIEQIVQVVAT